MRRILRLELSSALGTHARIRRKSYLLKLMLLGLVHVLGNYTLGTTTRRCPPYARSLAECKPTISRLGPRPHQVNPLMSWRSCSTQTLGGACLGTPPPAPTFPWVAGPSSIFFTNPNLVQNCTMSVLPGKNEAVISAAQRLACMRLSDGRMRAEKGTSAHPQECRAIPAPNPCVGAHS